MTCVARSYDVSWKVSTDAVADEAEDGEAVAVVCGPGTSLEFDVEADDVTGVTRSASRMPSTMDAGDGTGTDAALLEGASTVSPSLSW